MNANNVNNNANNNVNNLAPVQQYEYLLGFLTTNRHFIFPLPVTNPVIMLGMLKYANRRSPRNRSVLGRGLLRYFVSLHGAGIGSNVVGMVTNRLWDNATLNERTAYSNMSTLVNQIMLQYS